MTRGRFNIYIAQRRSSFDSGHTWPVKLLSDWLRNIPSTRCLCVKSQSDRNLGMIDFLIGFKPVLKVPNSVVSIAFVSRVPHFKGICSVGRYSLCLAAETSVPEVKAQCVGFSFLFRL